MSHVVHFIRHGVTRSNRERLYMGRSEEPLSPEGRWQARQLARRLRDLELEAVYASPLRRTRETAEILARPHRLRVEPEPHFLEIELRRWQGMSADEIAAAEPDAWRTWNDAPEELRVEGIEPLREVRHRVRRGLARLAGRHAHEAVAVVTHDVIVRMATMETLDLPMRLYRSLPVTNTSVTTLELAEARNSLRRFNDAAHVDGDWIPGPADE